MTVAALQRGWLERLERITERPILAQARREDPWLPWRFIDPTLTLWTRSLLENELLFETDNADPAFNRSCAERWAFCATMLGAKPLVADGGGKSWHVHVWIDPDLDVDAETLDAALERGVDVWRVVRVAAYDAIVALAALPADARLDRAKVQWSADKRGSMVREFGTPGSTGARKTLVNAEGVWSDGFAPWSEQPQARFPTGDPPLWRPSAELVAKIEAALKRAGRRSAATLPASGAFDAHPCVAKAMSDGAPKGERGITALHLAKLAQSEGLSHAEALGALEKYAEACASAGPMTDDMGAVVERVYAQAPSAIACPNPLGLSVCVGGACPKRAMRLGA